MTSAFEPMSAEERRRFASRYVVYLERRHGDLTRDASSLPFRQRFLEDMRSSVRSWPGAHVLGGKTAEEWLAEGSTDVRNPVLAWSLSAARLFPSLNGELPTFAFSDDVGTYVSLERQSHHELLNEVLKSLHLAPASQHACHSHWVTRSLLLKSQWIRGSISLGVATAKVVLLTLFYDQAVRVFSRQPAFAERTRQLLQEIIIDESGYAHYLRSQLNESQLKWARRAFLMTSKQWLADMPEWVSLVGQLRVKEELARARIFEIRQDMPRTSGVFRCVA